MTTIPDTSKHHHLVLRKGRFYAQYTVDGKVKCKSMKTEHFDEAVIARDLFFTSLKGVVKKPRTPAEKVASDPKKFVYYRPPYSCVVGKRHLGFFRKRKEAEVARDRYIETLINN